MNAKKSVNSPSTRDQLLLTAERLFATLGIESVSLRHIAREAGQKNVGAMQYHFGDREGLFEAIMEYRMSGLNARRWEMIADMDKRGRGEDLRSMLRCFVQPYVEHVRQEGLASYYVEFLSRFQVTFPHYLQDHYGQKPWRDSIYELGQRLDRALAETPVYIRRQRLSLMATSMIQGVGEFERNIRRGLSGMKELEVFTENLIDAIYGLLSAPVSDTTDQALARIEN